MIRNLHNSHFPQVLLFLFIGGFVGITLAFTADLPNKLFPVLMLGLSFPFLALLIKDLRRFLLAATILSIPLHIDINFMHSFEQQAGASTAGISLTDIFVIGLLLIWLIEIASQEQPYTRFFPRITIPAILYFEAAVLSMLWAPRLDLAFMEVLYMFKILLLFFVLINHIRDEKDLRLVVWAFIGAVAFEGLISGLQSIHGGRLGLDFLGEAPPDPESKGSIWRIMGTLGHPNKLATFMEMLLLMPIGMFITEKRSWARITCLAVFALGAIILILTGTRGAWIGFALGAVVFILYAGKNPYLEIKAVLKPALIVLVVLATAAAMLSGMLRERIYGDDYGSAASRIPMFKIALNVIAAHPLGGVGINNYQVNMREYNDAVESLRYISIPRPVHNMYLLVAGETGMIGLAAMLLMLIALTRTLLQTVSSPSALTAVTSISLLGGMAAFYLHGMVDKHPPGGSALFYAMMAVAVSAFVINKEQRFSVPPQSESLQHV
jgi:O-antigen ligase